MDDQLVCLRNASTDALQAANVGYPYPGRTNVSLFPWGPCIDNDLIEDTIPALLAAGKFIQVPLLFGNDNDEGSYFAVNANTTDDISTFFMDNYPLLTTNDTDNIVSTYSYLANTSTPEHGPLFAEASAAYGEATFICLSNTVVSTYAAALPAQAAQNNTAPAWNYRYNVLSASNEAAGDGVPHTYQDPALWGPGDPSYTADYMTSNAADIPLVMGYWTSFIKTLDVNAQAAPGAPVWETFGSDGKRLMFNASGASLEVVPADQNQRCAFWASLEPDTDM